METAFEHQAAVDQSACNQSFLPQGLLPSFVTLTGVTAPRKGGATAVAAAGRLATPDCPPPASPQPADYRISSMGMITLGR